MTKRQPCPDCHHPDRHSRISGCLADLPEGDFCPCETDWRPESPDFIPPEPRDRAADTAEGQELGRQGASAAEASHAMTVSPDGPEWRAKAEERLDTLIKRGTDFTADDVTDVVGVAPSPSAIGGLFKSRQKDMTPVGFTLSSRKVAHGRPLRVWKGKA